MYISTISTSRTKEYCKLNKSSKFGAPLHIIAKVRVGTWIYKQHMVAYHPSCVINRKSPCLVASLQYAYKEFSHIRNTPFKCLATQGIHPKELHTFGSIEQGDGNTCKGINLHKKSGGKYCKSTHPCNILRSHPQHLTQDGGEILKRDWGVTHIYLGNAFS